MPAPITTTLARLGNSLIVYSFAAEVGLAGDPGRVVDTVSIVTWSDVDVLDREAIGFRHGISTKWEGGIL